MGKPYAEEIARLCETYAWALGAPLDALSVAVKDASSYPLIAVGSGGSYTSAEFASAVHRQYTSGAASAMTPLEAVSTPQTLRDSAVMLFTAGGKNPDVIGAYRRLVGGEPRRLVVLCATTGAPLARIASENPNVDFIDFRPPSGKDGFLATNSLIATAVLVVRADAHATSAEHRLPPSLAELVGKLSPLPEGCAGHPRSPVVLAAPDRNRPPRARNSRSGRGHGVEVQQGRARGRSARRLPQLRPRQASLAGQTGRGVLRRRPRCRGGPRARRPVARPPPEAGPDVGRSRPWAGHPRRPRRSREGPDAYGRGRSDPRDRAGRPGCPCIREEDLGHLEGGLGGHRLRGREGTARPLPHDPQDGRHPPAGIRRGRGLTDHPLAGRQQGARGRGPDGRP